MRKEMPSAYRLSIALIAFVGLAIQLYYMLSDPTHPNAFVAIGRYLGYFTILTNILVCVTMGAGVLRPKSWLGQFSNRAGTKTAITLYIVFVGLVYHFMLSHLIFPSGLLAVADNIVHYVIPTLVFIDWAVFVEKRQVHLAQVPYWLAFPVAYTTVTILRVLLTGDHPYPFVDIASLGLGAVMLNQLGFAAAFLMGGYGLAIGGKYIPPVYPGTWRKSLQK